MDSLSALAQELRRFVDDRDWNQFHSPKNLTMALAVEVAELLEHFQWLTEEQSHSLSDEKLAVTRKTLKNYRTRLRQFCDRPETGTRRL